VKAVFVTPRYGSDVHGGAETGARRVAELLAARPGWSVEALSTTASDERTWADDFAAGSTDEHGVTVHRFAVDQGRTRDFDERSRRLFADLASATPADERSWVAHQGPVSTGLLDAVESSTADVLVFTPYLFDTTVRGVASVPGRAVLIPAAHDEAPIRLRIYRDLFASADGLVFHTETERRFANDLFPVATQPQAVIGLGCDPQPGDPAVVRHAIGLGDRPFVLCLGRVDEGKGTTYLARFFAAFKEQRPGPLALVIAGPVTDPPPAHPDMFVTGPVDEATKWGLLEDAEVLVAPSAHESFGIVLLEAWSTKTPVFVNARSAVSRDQAARADGGLSYNRYATFAAGLDRLLDDGWLRHALGANGHAYVDANYRWSTIADRYAGFLELVVGRRSSIK
jgi:glycosyltransferase involved in cell wall biosynthesis